MHGFIRIMTALPSYANISLAFCHIAEPLHLPRVHPPKKGFSQLLSLRRSTQQLGLDLPGGSAFTDGVQSKTEKRPPGWSVVILSAQRLPRHVWSPPEPAHMVAKDQSKNTAEVPALIEALRLFTKRTRCLPRSRACIL